jgi:hypothetical protein
MAEFTRDFFDESSRDFMRGKIRRGHMIYYQCTAVLKSGAQCGKSAIQDPFADLLCKQHIPKIDVASVEQIDKIDGPRRSQRLAEACKGQCRRSSRRKVPAKV